MVIFALTANPSDASNLFEARIAVTVEGLGFPYIPPVLRSNCTGDTCAVVQQTADLVFELRIPSDLYYRGHGCVFEKPGRAYELERPALHRNMIPGKITMQLNGIGKCKGRNIFLTFGSPTGVVTVAQRDEAFEMARLWFVCALLGPKQLACAQENPLDTSSLLIGLRRELEMWQ